VTEVQNYVSILAWPAAIEFDKDGFFKHSRFGVIRSLAAKHVLIILEPVSCIGGYRVKLVLTFVKRFNNSTTQVHTTELTSLTGWIDQHIVSDCMSNGLSIR